MRKIIILFALILLISISFVYADEPDTTRRLTLTDFNFEFDYKTPNLQLTLTDFNFEFNYILQTFTFNLSDNLSEYGRWYKLSELYPEIIKIKSETERWLYLSQQENDIDYQSSIHPYLKWLKLDSKY